MVYLDLLVQILPNLLFLNEALVTVDDPVVAVVEYFFLLILMSLASFSSSSVAVDSGMVFILDSSICSSFSLDGLQFTGHVIKICSFSLSHSEVDDRERERILGGAKSKKFKHKSLSLSLFSHLKICAHSFLALLPKDDFCMKKC